MSTTAAEEPDATIAFESSHDDLNEQMVNIWEMAGSNEEAASAAIQLIHKQMETLIRGGLDAFHRWDNCKRELKQSQQDCLEKQSELERLQAAEDKSRTTVTNLLSALETARNESREKTRSTVSESQLRAQLSVTVAQRNEAQGLADERHHKVQLIQDELRQTKAKMAKVIQEKAQLERDQRATLSLAKSLDDSSASSSSLEFYKRKVSVLSSQVQALNASMAEKNRQMDDIRRQLERSMSQNRLAQLSRQSGKSSKRRRHE